MPPEEADALFGACDAEGAGVLSYTALETCLSRQKGFTDTPPTIDHISLSCESDTFSLVVLASDTNAISEKEEN